MRNRITGMDKKKKEAPMGRVAGVRLPERKIEIKIKKKKKRTIKEKNEKKKEKKIEGETKSNR